MGVPTARDMKGQLESLLERIDILERRNRTSGGSGPGGPVSWSDITNKPTTFPPGQATEVVVGGARIATSTQVDAGTSDTTIVTPAKLAPNLAGKSDVGHTHTSAAITDFATAVPAAVPAATTTAQGKVELATSAEVATGTDAAKAVTPATLLGRTATDARVGLVELATTTEAAAGTDTSRAITAAGLKAAILAIAYPVGSIFTSVVNTNPGTTIGGTWVAWGTGRVPVGVDASQTEFNTVEKTGGAKTHTLTGPELPPHQHRLGQNYGGNLGFAESTGGPTQYTVGYGVTRGSSNDLKSGTQDTTTGQAHNNLQPYITAYMWKRTA